MSASLRVPEEHTEQCWVIQWSKIQSRKWPELELLHAIPNGGQRHKAVAGKLKAEGVKKGFPDLSLPVPRGGYHGLFIEMKRRKGGSLSADQKWWRDKLIEQGYSWKRCNGADEAYRVLTEYLTLPPLAL